MLSPVLWLMGSPRHDDAVADALADEIFTGTTMLSPMPRLMRPRPGTTILSPMLWLMESPRHDDAVADALADGPPPSLMTGALMNRHADDRHADDRHADDRHADEPAR